MTTDLTCGTCDQRIARSIVAAPDQVFLLNGGGSIIVGTYLTGCACPPAGAVVTLDLPDLGVRGMYSASIQGAPEHGPHRHVLVSKCAENCTCVGSHTCRTTSCDVCGQAATITETAGGDTIQWLAHR